MTQTLQYRKILDVINDYDVILFDLWGVIVEDDSVTPEMAKIINTVIAQKQVFFVSNNSRLVHSNYQRITNWGINARKDKIVTAGTVARHFLEDLCNKSSNRIKLYHLSNLPEHELTSSLDVEIIEDIKTADALLLTIYCDDLDKLDTHDDILKIAAFRKIPVICANPDISIVQSNKLRHCAGYYASKIERFGGNVTYAGKPKREIYDYVLQQIPEVPKERILMVGDTPDNDILGANMAGINAGLVLTGNCRTLHAGFNQIDDKINNITKYLQMRGLRVNVLVDISL